MMTDPNNNTHFDSLLLDPADGQQYLDELRDRLVALLSPAQTIEEVEDRLRKLYPESKLLDLAINEANKHKSDSHKNHKIRHHSTSSSGASLTDTLHNFTSLALAKVSNLVRDGVVGKGESELSKYKSALIRYIIGDVYNLACNFVCRQKGNFMITRKDIRTAMHADKDLVDMFLSDDKSLIRTENHPILARLYCTEKSNGVQPITYKQKLRNMVDSEDSFIRHLQLLIKVIRAELESCPRIQNEIQIVFCNIDELLELSNLWSSVLGEALVSVEKDQEKEIPFVGSEILDLASTEAFHAYAIFADKRLSVAWRQAHESIISQIGPRKSAQQSDHFDVAVRQLLPAYLLDTTDHFFQYFEDISELYEISKVECDRDDEFFLEQAISILIKTKYAIRSLLENEMDKEPIQLEPKLVRDIRASLERKLDAKLQIEQDMPLPFMPPPDIYRFSEPDSRENIQFEAFSEEGHENRIPVIKCATLTKLVERLTYHKHQPNIVDCILTTYPSYTSGPEELLDLLIERFKIPDPPLHIVQPNYHGPPDDPPECIRTPYKLYIRRFRQEYSKPVKMRVINVLRSWIKNRYNDFECQPHLMDKLNSFLDEVYENEKLLRGLIVSIKNSIEQKKICPRDFEFMFAQTKPPILWWLTQNPDEFDILTLHPVEFARQLTLIEFDLFRAIKPLELINVERRSSKNLSNLEKHFNLLSYWIQKCIVEAEDERKREAIYTRSIEIMAVLRGLNNYIGLLSIGSAIESSSITRLSLKRNLDRDIKKYSDDYNELVDQHLKKLQSELKSCNPPCIPYLGYYQTKLIQAKEGNKTFIDEIDTSTISPTLSNDESFANSPATPITPRPPPSATSTPHNRFFGSHDHRCKTPRMINFYKQRIQADIISEIRTYQDQPYCLEPEEKIQDFIRGIERNMSDFAKSLGALDSMQSKAKVLGDYSFEQSEKILKGPDKSRPKMPPKYKSPGIKF